MKDNTYIIPAIDFYIVIPNSQYEQFNSLEDSERKIKNNECLFIPFSKVDGLTIGELANIPEFSKGFIFCANNHLEFEMKGKICTSNNVHSMIFFPKRENLENSVDFNQRIDKVIENHYELCYQRGDDRNRAICNSFFERYQDGDYQKTKQRVKRLLGEKEN